MADLKTYSLVFNWDDDDTEKGTWGTTVRAADHDEAERKARAEMRDCHIANYCSEDDDDEDIAESCAQYETKEFDGTVTFGGTMVECSEGAIWKASAMEKALRAIIALAPAEKPVLAGDLSEMEDGADYEALASHHDALAKWEAAEIARPIIAEIDAI